MCRPAHGRLLGGRAPPKPAPSPSSTPPGRSRRTSTRFCRSSHDASRAQDTGRAPVWATPGSEHDLDGTVLRLTCRASDLGGEGYLQGVPTDDDPTRHLVSGPLWRRSAERLAGSPAYAFGTLAETVWDVVVVGGGLTGVTTALLLARAGCTVALLEARGSAPVRRARARPRFRCCRAPRSLLCRTRPRRTPLARTSKPTSRRRPGSAGMPRSTRSRCSAARPSPTQHQPGCTVGARGDRGRARSGTDRRLGRRHHAALSRGRCSRAREPAAARPSRAADRHGCRRRAARGGAGPGRRRPRHLRHRTGGRLDDAGEVRANRVVVATNLPFVDRGGHFAVPNPCAPRDGVPHAAASRRRDVPQRGPAVPFAPRRPGRRRLPALGGRQRSCDGSRRLALGTIRPLDRWTLDWFPEARLVHQWSAQDYRTSSHVPWAGPLLPRHDEILVARRWCKRRQGQDRRYGCRASTTLNSSEAAGGAVPAAVQEVQPWPGSFRWPIDGLARRHQAAHRFTKKERK